VEAFKMECFIRSWFGSTTCKICKKQSRGEFKRFWLDENNLNTNFHICVKCFLLLSEQFDEIYERKIMNKGLYK
jgi:hypothetical protein